MLSLWSDGVHVSERYQKVGAFHRQQFYDYNRTLYFYLVAPAPWWCLSLLKPFAQSLEDVFNRRSIADATYAMTTLACRELC